MAKSLPGDNLLFKFHGDLENPDSIVFSEDDYKERMNNQNHFLNIRLKADLLAKNLLFIGYSLRDINIKLILEELNEIFENELPDSYMIAWRYSDELKELCDEYKINLINPIDEFEDIDDSKEAFIKFLTELVRETIISKMDFEDRYLLDLPIPQTTRMVSKYEINGIKEVITSDDFDKSCKTFRWYIDRTMIPLDFEKEVLEMFKDLAYLSLQTKNANSLNDLAFNVQFENPNFRLDALSYLMTNGNYTHSVSFRINGVGEEFNILAIPKAIETLKEWNQGITDSFRKNIQKWVATGIDLDDYVSSKYVKEPIENVWDDTTTLENPFEYKREYQKRNKSGHFPTEKEIQEMLRGPMPKRQDIPFE